MLVRQLPGRAACCRRKFQRGVCLCDAFDWDGVEWECSLRSVATKRPGWIREYANLRSWHLAIGMVSVLLPRKLGGPRLGSFEILLVVGMEEILSPDDWGLVVAQFKHQVFDVFLGEVLRACCQYVKHRRAFGALIQIPKVVEGPGAFSQFVFSTTVRTFMLSWLFR